jgi:hypothetical protein
MSKAHLINIEEQSSGREHTIPVVIVVANEEAAS